MARAALGRPGTVYAASEGDKFNADSTLTVVNCATCHITYAIPESLEQSAIAHPGDTDRGWKLCCPLGHTWWYVGKTEADKVRDQLKRERAEAEWQRGRAGRMAAERDQALASAKAQKAAKTRIKNSRERERQRVAAGVCPECNRTFQNLARHMQGQHPDHAHHGEPS